ncbi:ATP-dependent nuclease subunit B [Opitutaceae bacterium TAV5]|nr:ATP-dependent nuclease subunit B [Opitutaceae bacterium TAV5]
MPAVPRLHSLSWKKPLAPAAAAWLVGDREDRGPLDLSDTLVIVPTAQSGRRLREALAVLAAARGQAVFPPHVVSPERFITELLPPSPPAESSGFRVQGSGFPITEPVTKPETPNSKPETPNPKPGGEAAPATPVESLLAWIEVLDAIDLDDFRAVFPVDPPARNFAWSSRLAREFQRLQATLAENALRMGDVTARAGDDFPETVRWQQLGRLEAVYDAALARRGLRDGQLAKITAATSGMPPSTITRIAVIATPDPLPLALRSLDRLAASAASAVTLHILVHGPESAAGLSALFDHYGRPRPDAWTRRPLDLPDFKQHVRLCEDPAAQAAAIVSYAGQYESADGVLAIGIADGEITPLVESGLARAGIPSHNPEGRPHRAGALHALLTALADLARERDPAFPSVAALARCPDILHWLRSRHRADWSAARFLAALDNLHAAHLPPTLSVAREHAAAAGNISLAADLDAIAALARQLLAPPFPSGLDATLADLFSAREFDLARPDDARTVEAAGAWRDALAATTAALRRFPRIAPADAFDLALRAFGDATLPEEKSPRAIDLQGWLELPWDDTPHLVIAGLNDGRVPEAVNGDAFLPESLRERLGLKTNAARFARDAYLLQTLVYSRGQRPEDRGQRTEVREQTSATTTAGSPDSGLRPLASGLSSTGRLDLLVGKTSAAGDPLRPSRLLLQCADADLPGRVLYLFGTPPSGRASLAWRRAWKLAPRTDAPIEKLSVTAFRDYLRCPFRFYLKHALRMRAVDPDKAELDALDFGNLCHAALEAMGRPESGLRDCADPALLRDFLLDRLEACARATWGEQLPLPLVVQLESARQRLSRAAGEQARLRAEGWLIERTEYPVDLVIGGLPVRGKIDRIDRNETTGAIRVLDYKTSDSAVNPVDAHLRKPRRNDSPDTLPPWTLFSGTGTAGSLLWTDLQLPLYLRAVAPEYGDAVACGYFNLPKAIGETRVSEWLDYTPATQRAADTCAEGIVAAIAARRFWPPAELTAAEAAYDDYAALFHNGAADSIEWPCEQ